MASYHIRKERFNAPLLVPLFGISLVPLCIALRKFSVITINLRKWQHGLTDLWLCFEENFGENHEYTLEPIRLVMETIRFHCLSNKCIDADDDINEEDIVREDFIPMEEAMYSIERQPIFVLKQNMLKRLRRTGKFNEELELSKYIWEEAVSSYGEFHELSIAATHDIAEFHRAQHGYEEATIWLEKVALGYKESNCILKFLDIHLEIAFMKIAQKNLGAAKQICLWALSSYEKHLPKGELHLPMLYMKFMLSTFYYQEHKFLEAIKYANEAVDGCEKYPGPGRQSAHSQEPLGLLWRIYVMINSMEQAELYFAELADNINGPQEIPDQLYNWECFECKKDHLQHGSAYVDDKGGLLIGVRVADEKFAPNLLEGSETTSKVGCIYI